MSHAATFRSRMLQPLLEAVTVDGGISPLVLAGHAAALGTSSVATARTGLDASVAGEVGQVVSFTTRIPQHFQAAMTALVRATWEVTSAAAAGATARPIVRVLKAPPQGSGEIEIVGVNGPIVAIDALATFNHRFRDDIGDHFFPQGTWRRDDLITLLMTWEVMNAAGGTFDVSVHHDPGTADDRLLLYMGAGE